MNPCDPGPSSPQAPTPSKLRPTPVRDCAGWGFVSFAAHVLFFGGLFVLLPGGPVTPKEQRIASARFDGPPLPVLEELEVCEEECEAIEYAEIVAEEPVIKDEEIADHIETDVDLPYQDSIGTGGVGLSDAPFEGPASNATLGMGGGAGGAFAGRGGSRDLGCGGGGRARAGVARSERRRGGRAGQGRRRWPCAPRSPEARAHRAQPPFKTEGYDRIRDNPFRRAIDADISTFSIDVDTASYANVRRYLVQTRSLPPKDAVRIEELLNYFPYTYEPPMSDAGSPFRTHVQVAGCPWNPRHRLARIALKGKVIARHERPQANLVFLLDVSGSMRPANKLPLLKRALSELVRQLRDEDRVAIVVYAGAAGLALPSTRGGQQRRILRALANLRSGGSTNGGAGLQLAYKVATQHFVEGGVNRVILATDGDFNVGVSDRGDLTRLIEQKARTGVFLSVLGFGMGNYKDDRMEELTNKGNGNYAYIDTLQEARKVLVDQASGTLVTIAKDVKIQVFFNPARVAGYRLIGYENRILAKEDFNDDKKDAGEIGAGHTVTALYELVPAGTVLPGPGVDPNPFIRNDQPARTSAAKALFRLRLRYKQPDGDTSTLMERDVFDRGHTFAQADRELQWAAAVAAFGMLLRDSPHKGNATWDAVIEIARPAVGIDPDGYRREFVTLVERAKRLALNERG